MPDFVQNLLWISAAVAAVLTIAGGVLALHRLFKRLDVIGEGVLGKPEVLDYSGAVIEPAVPSIQARVSSLEAKISQSNQEKRVASLEAWREEHTRDTDTMVNRLMDHVLGPEGK